MQCFAYLIQYFLSAEKVLKNYSSKKCHTMLQLGMDFSNFLYLDFFEESWKCLQTFWCKKLKEYNFCICQSVASKIEIKICVYCQLRFDSKILLIFIRNLSTSFKKSFLQKRQIKGNNFVIFCFCYGRTW